MLFGTSGVRGVVNKELTPMLALEIGMALGSYVRGCVVLGQDTRTSSEMISKAVVSGLLCTGANVLDLGVASTPTVGICVKEFGAKAGITVTASHNPPQYNGIKIWDDRGLVAEYEGEIEEIIATKNFRKVEWNKIGGYERRDGIKIHKKILKKNINLKGCLRIALDCGNGVASLIAPHLFQELGFKVLTINSETSGFFSRGLEPTEKNLGILKETVKSCSVDLGFAYDGDADRVGVVDEKGEYVDYDTLLALISKYMVDASGEKRIVTTLDASLNLEEFVACRVLKTRIGEKYVSRELQKGGCFGGEPSGTWIFPSYSLTPDGIYSSLKILEMKENWGDISELRKKVPKYHSLRKKIECENSKKKVVMERIEEKIQDFFSPQEILKIDGLFLKFKNSFLLIRPSGTEPYIRVRVEAKDEKRAKELLEKGLGLVRGSINF